MKKIILGLLMLILGLSFVLADTCSSDSDCNLTAACDTSSGECKECIDSDGGIDSYVLGTTSGIYHTVSYLKDDYVDKCDPFSENVLFEYYCKIDGLSTKIYKNDYTCVAGEICEDGVCVEESCIDAGTCECITDDDCNGFICDGGVCLMECDDDDVACAEGYACSGGVLCRLDNDGDGIADVEEVEEVEEEVVEIEEVTEICANSIDDDANGEIDQTGGCDTNNDGIIDYICGCGIYNKKTKTFSGFRGYGSNTACPSSTQYACMEISTSKYEGLTCGVGEDIDGVYYKPDTACMSSSVLSRAGELEESFWSRLWDFIIFWN